MTKLDKLRQVAGNERVSFAPDDLDKDFDPNEHEAKMNVKIQLLL